MVFARGINEPLTRLIKRLDAATARLEAPERQARFAAEALPLLPAILGDQGPRRYFLAVQTPAEALLVTMTETRLTPTASRSGSPKPSVRSGTIRMPPPRPSKEPNTPAAIPPTIRPRPAITSGGVGGRRSDQGRKCCGA